MAEIKAPLTTALKPNVSAGEEAETRYQDALNQLMERLDSRKNRLFDPTLLAMASGFLAPTQTGGFGESLGYATKAASGAEAQQAKEDIDLAQMRLQVAQGAREQASRLKGQEAFRSILGGETPTAGAPSTTTRAEVAPSGAPTATPSGQQTGQVPTGGLQNLTVENALAFAAAFPENKDMAKILMDAAKAKSDRFVMSMNGTVFDRWNEKYVAQIPPGQVASEFYVPELGENRTLRMTPGQYDQYQKARDAGVGQEWVKDFTSPTAGKKPPMGEPTKPKSAAELEAETQAKIVSEKKMAESEAERFNNAITKGDDAGERISQYNRLKATAQKPDANKIFGVFENGKFSDAVFKYLESNNGIISAKNIRDIWTDLGLPPEQISDKQLALSIIAQQQFAFSSLAKGQGAISDFERQLFNAMGADIKDRPDTIVRKMDMLTARAEFDREISRMARAARKQGIGYDDMKDSTKYQDAYQKYLGKLMDIVEGSGRTVPKQSTSAGASATQPTNPAAAKLRADLGIKD